MLPAGGPLAKAVSLREEGEGSGLGRPETPCPPRCHLGTEPQARSYRAVLSKITDGVIFCCTTGPICFFLLHSTLHTQPTPQLFLQDVNAPTRTTQHDQGTPETPMSPCVKACWPRSRGIGGLSPPPLPRPMSLLENWRIYDSLD